MLKVRSNPHKNHRKSYNLPSDLPRQTSKHHQLELYTNRVNGHLIVLPSDPIELIHLYLHQMTVHESRMLSWYSYATFAPSGCNYLHSQNQ